MIFLNFGFFSGGSCSPPPPAKNSFWTGSSLNNNKPYGGGRFYYGKKPNNRNRHSAQYGGKQNNKWHNRFSDKKISGSKPGSLVQKISRIDSRRISNKFSPFSKTFVYRTNPTLAIRKKMSSFQKVLGDYGIAGRRSHKKSGTSIPRSIPEQYSAVKKEGWGKLSLYKLKTSQQFYSIQAFQNGRFALLEILSREKLFSLRERSERCL